MFAQDSTRRKSRSSGRGSLIEQRGSFAKQPELKKCVVDEKFPDEFLRERRRRGEPFLRSFSSFSSSSSSSSSRRRRRRRLCLCLCLWGWVLKPSRRHSEATWPVVVTATPYLSGCWAATGGSRQGLISPVKWRTAARWARGATNGDHFSKSAIFDRFALRSAKEPLLAGRFLEMIVSKLMSSFLPRSTRPRPRTFHSKGSFL
mmetsp:Transcript_33997/g.109132  ORF Transcript_33997/g.109132 Transcript_33997/m.109132 type:complete len:203 (-) Transcript_33997:1082-1690(-)